MLRSSRTGPTKTGSLSRASAVIVGALVALFGVIAGPLLGVFAVTSAGAATTGSGYTAITPFRALGTSAAGAAVTAGTPVVVPIVGNTAAPTAVPTGATAVVLNVTASSPTSAGFLEVYPGGAAPTSPTSNVNFTAGEAPVPNLVTVPLSSTGTVSVLNFAGTTAVDVDVEGYYSASGAGLYNPVPPVRAAGTAAKGATITAGTPLAVTVTGGTTGVPTSATAVVVNLTAAGGSAASFLSAYAAGATPNVTSSVNFTAGETVANRDIVNVGTAGAIDVTNFAGTVNVDVDIDGYYGATGSAFVPLAAPIRLTDTRTPTSLNGTPVASGGTETLNLSTAASTIPTTATAVAANFTVVPGAAPGYITVFPTGVTTAPTASDVNWPANSGPVANFTQADTAGTPTGSAQVFNLASGSPVDLVVDAFGYFTAGSNATSNSVNIGVPSTTSNSISVPDLVANMRTVTATVTNGAGGAVVSSDPVTFTLSPAGCGTITSPVSTISTGVATATYTPPTFVSGTTPATCTVTAKDSDFGQTGTATIALTQPPNSVVLGAAAASVPANGTTTDLLTATVTAGATGTANNDAVSFATAGTCGTVGTPSGTTGPTNAASVTATYTAGTTAGFCTVTATEAATGSTASFTIDQKTSPALTAATVTFNPTAGSGSPTFGGSQTFTVTVGNPGVFVGDQVNFSVAPTSVPADTCGTLAPTSGVTSSTGTISVVYTASTTATVSPSCTISATEADTAVTATAVVTQLAAAPVVVTTTDSSPNNNVPIGTATTISVSVSNVTNGADNGGAVTFIATGTGCGANPTATTLAVPVGSTTGTASTSYTASSTVGALCTITATANSTAPAAIGTGAVQVDQVA